MVGLPYFPRSSTAAPQILELLFVLERVHGRPETVVGISDQLPLVDEPLERPVDQFLFLADVVEDLEFENEVAVIDTHRAIIDGGNAGNQMGIPVEQRNHVIAQVWTV